MINRTLNVGSAITLGFVFIAMIALSENAARAADACRAAPGAETPQGGHWRYRLEKGTGKKCWYLSGATETKSKAAEEPKAAAAAPAKSASTQSSFDNAHAELTAPDAAASSLNETVWPPMQQATPDAGSASLPAERNQVQIQDQTPQQNIVLAQRWPEPNSVPSADERSADNIRARVQTAQAAPSVAATPDRTTPAAQPDDDSPFNPVRIFLVAMIGVLALAGMLLRVVISYAAKRRRLKAPRRPIWDDTLRERPAPPYVQHRAPVRHPQHAMQQQFDDREAREEIEYLLRRAARRDQR